MTRTGPGPATAPVPVSILTGFLGAGKTTLLNASLRDPALAATAVIVNEFGAVGIDHLLVEAVDGDLMVLTTGCLCCAARGDLSAALASLLRRRADGFLAFDRVVIETTGLADPGPILNAALLDPGLWRLCRVQALVTLVDVVDGAAVLEAHPEAARQVALADRIVLTKTDLASEGGAADARTAAAARVRALNPHAPILDGAAARRDAAGLFAPVHHFGGAPRPRPGSFRAEAVGPHDGVGSLVLRAGIIDPRGLETFLAVMRERFGPRVLRLKGLAALRDDPDRPALVQAVQHMLHPVTRLPAWPDRDRGTRLVVILADVRPGEVAELWDMIFGGPAIDRPDAQALADHEGGGAGLFG